MRLAWVSRLVLMVALTVISSFGQNASSKDIYQRGLNAFAGGPLSRSDFRGFDDIRKAADMGYAPAQFTLGYMLETGTYTGGGLSDAVNWYRKAAEQGDRLAQWNLGRCYYTGVGVATDLDKAESVAEAGSRPGRSVRAVSTGKSETRSFQLRAGRALLR